MLDKVFYDQLLKKSFDIPVKVIYWDNKSKIYGDKEPKITIKINNIIPVSKILKNASLALGEAYMNRDIEIEGPDDSIEQLLTSAYKQSQSFFNNNKFRRFIPKMSHSQKSSKEDVQNHYDLGNQFYALWLDKTMTYSCAYFTYPEESLENAQKDKINHILTKLHPKTNKTLLDIGCGWGTLMLTAAKKYHLKVTGITLSTQQYEHIKKEIKKEHLEDLATVKLQDYRNLPKKQKFDYITSIGMFEHVGKENLEEYFNTVANHLNKNGSALIHGITRQQGGATNAWLNKWIFPGGYIPGLGENTSSITKSGLQIYDLESLRRHYQKTTEIWDKNFKKQSSKIKSMFDDKFVRMWDLYLQACAASFKAGNIDVIQYLISNGPSGEELPKTRKYMYQEK